MAREFDQYGNLISIAEIARGEVNFTFLKRTRKLMVAYGAAQY